MGTVRNHCSVKVEKPFLKKSREIHKNLEEGCCKQIYAALARTETEMSLKGYASPYVVTSSPILICK